MKMKMKMKMMMMMKMRRQEDEEKGNSHYKSNNPNLKGGEKSFLRSSLGGL